MIGQNATTPGWDIRLQKIVIFIGRLGLAYLFFSQLFWKLPPTFGCANDFALPQPATDNYWTANGSSGLCFWLGMESIYKDLPRDVLVVDMRPAGLPKLGIPLTPLAQALTAPDPRLRRYAVRLAELNADRERIPAILLARSVPSHAALNATRCVARAFDQGMGS